MTLRQVGVNNYPSLMRKSITQSSLEIEVKLACDDLDRFRRAGMDLKLTAPRHFEDNWLLDSVDQKLFNAGAALRVRFVNDHGLVTYKGIVRESARSPLKVREEIECDTSDPHALITLFERLGFHRSFRYQKYRTIYSLRIGGEEIEVVFDETPLGNFIELEGDETRVLSALEAAGFTTADFIRESYPELQAARCQERGVPLEDLIF
ncbi:MAG: class IV adenylate cyclase [Acidobacteriota bacterium]